MFMDLPITYLLNIFSISTAIQLSSFNLYLPTSEYIFLFDSFSPLSLICLLPAVGFQTG